MKRTSLTAVALLTVALLLVGCGVAVPDVTGSSREAAEAKLTAAGFTVGSVSYDGKPNADAWTVTSQSPVADERADKGTPVSLVIAGMPPVQVPSLTGLTKTEAEVALKSVGLVLGDTKSAYDDTVPKGDAVSQEPSSGVEAQRDSAVALVFSKGKTPVAVPSVKGKTREQAVKALKSAGFKVKVTDKENAAKKGTVLSQKPSGGKAQPDTTVALVVSTGVQMVRVPDVVGAVLGHSYQTDYETDPNALGDEATAVAMSTLARAGLRADFSFQSIMQENWQKPRAGAMVPKGTVVTVRIGFGD